MSYMGNMGMFGDGVKKFMDQAKTAMMNKSNSVYQNRNPPDMRQGPTMSRNDMTTESTKASTAGAAPQMAAYDQYAQAALGASPEQAMANAQAAAAQQAQAQADLATQQAIRAGKTGGAMQGQAALGAQQQAANAYGQAQQAAQQQYFNTAQLGAQLGSEMSGRLARAGQTEAGLKQTGMSTASAERQTGMSTASAERQAELNAQTSKNIAKMQNKTERRGQNMGLIGNAVGAIGGLAGLFSDRNLKDDIEPDPISEGLDKIRAYTYRYKGSGKPEAGIIAQELEGTKMAPAVVETPMGKMLDTNRLTAMNTGALSEHEGRLKKIESMLKGLAEVKR